MYYRGVEQTDKTASDTHIAAMARFGHALSDPTRTAVLLALRHGPAYPADLAEQLAVTRQTMSNHLSCLRGCGLVETHRDGRRTRYTLADPHLAAALDELMRVVLTTDPQCCAEGKCTC